MYESKSVPPVDPITLNITAVPSPIKIPPYMQASNLSLVKGWYLSNISINIESNNVPAIDFIKNSFPILKNPNINNGIFNISIVVPSGILKT